MSDLQTSCVREKVATSGDGATKSSEYLAWETLYQRAQDQLRSIPAACEIQKLMDQCWQRAQEKGLPIRRNQDWRYAVMHPSWRDCMAACAPGAEKISAFTASFQCDWLPGVPQQKGCLESNEPLRTQVKASPAGVHVLSMEQALQHSKLADKVSCHVQKWMKQRLDADNKAHSNEGMFYFTASTWQQGLVVWVEAGVHLDQTLSIQLMQQSGLDSRLCLIVLEESAQAQLCLDWSNPCTDAATVSMLTHIDCAADSVLDVYYNQTAPASLSLLHDAQIDVAERAHVYWHALAAGATLSREAWQFHLQGEGAQARLLSVGRSTADGQYLAQRTRVIHHHPGAVSWQMHRALVGHAAQALFQGYVQVKKGAGATVADQDTAFLLLSDKGCVVTQPALEIYADDVQCSHGATVGELDTDALFYLQARGVSPVAARAMLTQSFMDQVFDEYRDAQWADYCKNIFYKK